MNRDRQQDDDSQDIQERPEPTCKGMADVPGLIEEDD